MFKQYILGLGPVDKYLLDTILRRHYLGKVQFCSLSGLNRLNLVGIRVDILLGLTYF